VGRPGALETKKAFIAGFGLGRVASQHRRGTWAERYWWRLGLAEGESSCETLERWLAEPSVIDGSTNILGSDADGAPHADPATYARTPLRAPTRTDSSRTRLDMTCLRKLRRPLPKLRSTCIDADRTPTRAIEGYGRGRKAPPAR
jgi:hypothetical protein